MTISRRGFRVAPDAKVPPGSRIPQAGGAGHLVGGPQPVKAGGPPEFWTEPISDDSGSEIDQFRRHVRDFLDAVKSRRPPISDVESAHRVSTACHLANLSLRLGRKLRWDAAKEDVIGDPEASRLLVRPYRGPWDAELKAMGVR